MWYQIEAPTLRAIATNPVRARTLLRRMLPTPKKPFEPLRSREGLADKGD